MRLHVHLWRDFLLTMTMGLIFFPALSQNQDDHSIAPELAGKWCFYNLANGDEGRLSNTCVTLNADGSYEFFIDGATMTKVSSLFPGTPVQESDYGTWWVQGSRIFYSSQTHGKGSFQFQKMNQPTDTKVPLILLNGITFAPASPRDPW